MKLMKIVSPIVMLILLTACGPSAADSQAAIDTQVAALINQQATVDAASAATTAPTESAATAASGPVNVGGVQIQIPQEAAACLPIGTAQVVGVVGDVIDGDEFRVVVNDQGYDVRLIGINAPDGESPTAALVQLIEDKQVLLVTDITDIDEYGRLVRYVITADGVFVNLEMVRQGQAFPSPEEPDLSCEDTIGAAGPQ